MMKRSAVLAMLVAGLAAGGCGGNDDKGASTTPEGAGAGPTKAQYIASADKICKATTDKIAVAATKLRASADKSGTALPEAQQVQRFLTQTTLPAFEAMLDDLRALAPPKADEKTIDGLIAALAGAIDTVKAAPAKYSRDGQADPFDDANARAMNYGMKVCGST